MSLSFVYSNVFHEPLWLVDYYAYWIVKNEQKNPAFDQNSREILNVKDSANQGHQKAVANFSRLLAAKMKEVATLQPLSRIQIAIVPKREAGKVAAGLKGIANRLAGLDNRFEVPSTNILVRTKTIDKLANGGDRSVSVHLGSIVATMPSNRKKSPVLLLDDVGTTGNSLNACTQLLYQAGASLVVPVVLGRTV